MDIRKIEKINQVVDEYFANNPSVDKVQAKDLMPLFIKAGISPKTKGRGCLYGVYCVSLTRTTSLT